MTLSNIKPQNGPAAQAQALPSSATVMRVLEQQVYRGPNLYGYRPMIRIQLNLGTLEGYPSSRLEGFTQRLLQQMPSLQEHGCSYGEPGGFVRRLHEGTWLGHIIEHVAIELQSLAGLDVTYGKTRSVPGQPGTYNVVYEHREEQIGRLAGLVAIRLVNSLLPAEFQGVEGLHLLRPRGLDGGVESGGTFDLAQNLEELCRLVGRYALGPTTASLVAEARRRGIPHLRLDDDSLVQLGYGRHQRRIRASITQQTSYLATETASDKALTKRLLDRAGLPVPDGEVVTSAEQAVRAAGRIGYPVVIKPLDGNHGRGVSLGLETPQQVAWGYELAARHSHRVVIEQQFRGNDHRILVVGGEVVAVAERVPAQVVGDGEHSVTALVHQVNLDPRRGEGHEQVMTRIVLDEQVREVLARQGLTPQSVPARGEVVMLRDTANLSTGGTAIDRTDVIHPDNVTVARRAAQIIGLDVAGIDFISPDISQSVFRSGGGIVEVNASPGFRMHLHPSVGTPRNVAAPVIDRLFPEGTPCRIPVVAITGTNGKSTTSRMVAHVLQHAGRQVGLTTSNGIYLQGERILEGDTTGPKSARVILSDPTVEVAVLETARGGILREGLGFDQCQVGAVLNVRADHLGLRGIETVEDLAFVKSLVVEVVAKGGLSVLNADDGLTAGMAGRAGGTVAYFSMQGAASGNAHLLRHIEAGGLAVVREPTLVGDELVLYRLGERHPVIRAAEIPATLNGAAQVNVENALAATLILVGLEVPLPVIRAGLATFTTSFEHSPGRLNLFEGHPFQVLLDYAHNPDGLTRLSELLSRLRPLNGQVIGVFGVAGDRRDQDIHQMGELLAGMFDHLILREDEDRRGRQPGEGAHLTHLGALAGGLAPERMEVILDEREAIGAALRRAQAGDLVVILPNLVEEAWQQVKDFDSSAVLPLVHGRTA